MSDPLLDRPTPSLDVSPDLARLGNRQQFLLRWYQTIALAPLAILVLIGLRLFPDSGGRWADRIVLLTLSWPVVAGCAMYLVMWGGIRCPVCEQRFGSGDQCRSCNLPRHHRTPFLLPDLTPAAVAPTPK